MKVLQFSDDYPCKDQAEAEIGAYYRNAHEGDLAVVRETQGHTLDYHLVEITGINPGRGRIYVRQFGAFYAKHGRNCFHPKGQTTLRAPRPYILDWKLEHGRWYGYEMPIDAIRVKLGIA